MPSLKNYLSLIKFSHTVFALPFAIIGFFLAYKHVGWETPPWRTGGLILLCMIFARTAAMAFNRYIDRDIDSTNARTKSREIPSGVISPAAALTLVIISSALFILTTWFINPVCFFLSPVALAVVLGYSLTKRFTWLCHFILGLGLSLAPIGAYLAVTGVFNIIPLLFSFTVLTWVGGFDIIYALQDEEFDKAQKLYSIPALLGKKKAMRVSEAAHFISMLCVISAGILITNKYEFTNATLPTDHFGADWYIRIYSYLVSGLWYWIGAAVFTSLLIYQHSLVKPNDLSKVNLAFFTMNGIASIVFAAFVVTEVLWK